MDLQSLRDEWSRLSDDEAPPAMSKELLRLAIAYRRQEQEFGGLSRRTSIRLRALHNGGKANVRGEALPPKPGVKLLREWQGKVYPEPQIDNAWVIGDIGTAVVQKQDKGAEDVLPF